MSIENRAKDFYNSQRIKKLRKYDNPVVKIHVIDKIKFIKNNLDLSKDTKVLEVGAGSGYFSYYLQDYCNLLATDVNESILSLNPAKNKKVCDGNKLPFKNNFFDVVVAFDILHHVDHPNKVLNEMIRVSKKNLIIIEPNADNFIQKLFLLFFPREWGTYRFTTEHFLRMIKKNNLKILKHEYIGRLITPNSFLPLSLLQKIPYTSSPQLNLSHIVLCEKR